MSGTKTRSPTPLYYDPLIQAGHGGTGQASGAGEWIDIYNVFAKTRATASQHGFRPSTSASGRDHGAEVRGRRVGKIPILATTRATGTTPVEYPQEIPADPPKIPALGCSSEDPRGRGRPPRIPAENVPHNIPKWTVFPELARCSS